MDNKNKNRGYAMVLISALMFGSYGIWSRLIGDAFGNFFQSWTRALIILIIIIPIALYKKEVVKIKKEDIKWIAVFMISTSLTQAPFFYAFNHLDIGLASLLFFVSMFLTMHVIGLLFFNEKATKIKIISSLIAIAGMYLVFSFSISFFAMFAVAMAILNGIASGSEVAFSKKLSDKYSPLYLLILSWGIILVSNGLISYLIGENQVSSAFTMPWFWQLCFSAASILGFWLVIAGYRYIDVGIGAIIGLLEIVFSVLFGILVFNEVLSLRVGIGAVLIIAAAALPHLFEIFCSKKIIKACD